MISKKSFEISFFGEKRWFFLENFPKIENLDVILFCVFFYPRKLEGLYCRKRSETTSNRFSWISRWALKKIPSKNIFALWRKIILKKKVRKKVVFWFVFIIFFQVSIYLKKKWFFNRKIKMFVFFLSFFFQIYFSPWCKIFLMGFF